MAWRNIDIELWEWRREGATAQRSVGREVGGLGPPSRTPEQRVSFAAQQVVEALRLIDMQARRAERTVPTAEEREIVASTFWYAVREFGAVDRLVGAKRARCAATARSVLHPWLLRSDYWSRSYLKPHGYAGDFRTLEWIYDLERDACADPTKPAVVNLLDALYRSVHSVRAVWHRRRWYAQLVAELLETSPARQPVRILDLACGGSRYVRDVIGNAAVEGTVELTFLDRDPAALSFIRSWLPAHLRGRTRLICGPAGRARKLVCDDPSEPLGRFDLVISTGLFDYLDSVAARCLLSEMTRLTRPGGLVAVSNFAPEDASRVVKDWIVSWPLVYRPVSALRDLVPEGHSVEFDRLPGWRAPPCIGLRVEQRARRLSIFLLIPCRVPMSVRQPALKTSVSVPMRARLGARMGNRPSTAGPDDSPRRCSSPCKAFPTCANENGRLTGPCGPIETAAMRRRHWQRVSHLR